MLPKPLATMTVSELVEFSRFLKWSHQMASKEGQHCPPASPKNGGRRRAEDGAARPRRLCASSRELRLYRLPADVSPEPDVTEGDDWDGWISFYIIGHERGADFAAA